MVNEVTNAEPTSARTTVRRGAKRADYRVKEMHEILRAGSVAHVAVITEEGPLVLPMVYGIGADVMYLHGALANSLLKAGVNAEVCATVTILDGLVFAKTPFNHSMNYRSVVVRGTVRLVEDEQEVLHALQLMTDHVVPTWDTTRRPSASEIRVTRVVALPLTEMSAKVRAEGAINVPEDEGAPYWSGYVPIRTVAGTPITNEDSGAPIPEAIRILENRDVHREGIQEAVESRHYGVHMADEKVKGPASYFPSIEKKYGKPISHWKSMLKKMKGAKHSEMVAMLKTEHEMGHGHANAIVADFRAENGL